MILELHLREIIADAKCDCSFRYTTDPYSKSAVDDRHEADGFIATIANEFWGAPFFGIDTVTQ